MLFFFLGTIIGSFLNVVIIRTPNNQSIIYPRSHCFKCQKKIPFYYNIPILSFIILKGKCFNCNEKISLQYILVETLTGILFYIIFNLFPLNQAILLAVVFSALIILSVIDIYHLLIHIYLIAILYISIILKIFIYNETISKVLLGSLATVLYLAIPCIFIIIIKKDKNVLGFGDILLSAFIGGWMGAINGILCLFLASVIGISFFFYSIIINKRESVLKIPFGACISIAFIIIVIIEKYYNFKLFAF